MWWHLVAVSAFRYRIIKINRSLNFTYDYERRAFHLSIACWDRSPHTLRRQSGQAPTNVRRAIPPYKPAVPIAVPEVRRNQTPRFARPPSAVSAVQCIIHIAIHIAIQQRPISQLYSLSTVGGRVRSGKTLCATHNCHALALALYSQLVCSPSMAMRRLCLSRCRLGSCGNRAIWCKRHALSVGDGVIEPFSGQERCVGAAARAPR